MVGELRDPRVVTDRDQAGRRTTRIVFVQHSHNRRGFFWSERFKSVIVDNGDTLINCLAYIDLNPVRAQIVEKPEEYRWSSIGLRSRGP